MKLVDAYGGQCSLRSSLATSFAPWEKNMTRNNVRLLHGENMPRNNVRLLHGKNMPRNNVHDPDNGIIPKLKKLAFLFPVS